jgi:hypothetical protein
MLRMIEGARRHPLYRTEGAPKLGGRAELIVVQDVRAAQGPKILGAPKFYIRMLQICRNRD